MIWSPDRSAVAVSSFSSNLSPAQVFGRQLAAWRNRAGLTQEKVAREASISLSYFRKIESGDRTPTEHLAKVADDLCEADGILMALFEQLSSSFREQTFPGWFGEWVDDVEAAAVTLRTYEPLLAPGLLQVESYAMAILSTRIGDSRDEIDEMVSARMARQQILEREKPPALWAILDEGVFRRCVGGPGIMRLQCRHLREMASRTDIVIRVIPLSTGAHEGLSGGFVIADLPEGKPPVAYLDNAAQGQTAGDQETVKKLEALWATLGVDALPRTASLELMKEAERSWTTE
jgi:transcriptional regulator with XRE-family HTH domain